MKNFRLQFSRLVSEPDVRVMGALVSLYFLFRLCCIDVPFIWDGRVYYARVAEASSGQLDLAHLAPFRHSSIVFMALAVLWHKLTGGSVLAFNAGVTLFFCWGLSAFYRILRSPKFAALGKTDAFLVTCLLGVNPGVLANTVNFNLDIGVLVFFLAYWRALLEGELRWATLWATALVFSKEPGAVVLVTSFLATIAWRRARGEPVRAKQFAVLLVPGALFGAWLGWRQLSTGTSGVFVDFPVPALADIARILNPFAESPRLITFFGLLFVANFAWVLTLMVGIGSVFLVFSHSLRKRPALLHPIFFVSLLMLALGYCLSRFLPHMNFRYMMVIVPLLLLLCAMVAFRAIADTKVRYAFWSLAVVMMGYSSFRTIDPVSKAYFGTVAFGHRELLDVTSRTRDRFLPVGRDQLVYNLEIFQLTKLVEQAYRRIAAGPQSVVLSPASSTFDSRSLVLGPFKRRSYRIAPGEPDAVEPRIWYMPELERDRREGRLQPVVHYLEFFMADSNEDLQTLSKWYGVSSKIVLDRAGYQMNLHSFYLPRELARIETGKRTR